jgi:hypothetical protein
VEQRPVTIKQARAIYEAMTPEQQKAAVIIAFDALANEMEKEGQPDLAQAIRENIEQEHA